MTTIGEDRPIQKRYFLAPIVVLLVVLYLGFLLYQAIFVNYQTNKKIAELNKTLEQTKQEQQELEVLIAYYQTSAFQELEARKKLGLKMPGEKVINVDVPEEKKPEEDKEPARQSGPEKSNPQLWFEYLFYQSY